MAYSSLGNAASALLWATAKSSHDVPAAFAWTAHGDDQAGTAHEGGGVEVRASGRRIEVSDGGQQRASAGPGCRRAAPRSPWCAAPWGPGPGPQPRRRSRPRTGSRPRRSHSRSPRRSRARSAGGRRRRPGCRRGAAAPAPHSARSPERPPRAGGTQGAPARDHTGRPRRREPVALRSPPHPVDHGRTSIRMPPSPHPARGRSGPGRTLWAGTSGRPRARRGNAGHIVGGPDPARSSRGGAGGRGDGPAQSWRVSRNTGNRRVVFVACLPRSGASATSFGHSSARARPSSSSASTVNARVPTSTSIRGWALRL